MKNNLAEIRTKKGWSQQQLALYSHVSRDTINLIEMGTRKNPTVQTALLLSHALKVTVEDLFQLQ